MYPDLDFSSLLAEDQDDFPMDDESHDESSYENDDEPPNEIDERPRLINFVIPDLYKTHNFAGNIELFLLGDSGPDDANRILLFGRESHGGWAAQMKTVFLDGTFKITPAPFSQVYVISAERNHFVFPILQLYCRMIPALSFVRLNDVKQYAATLFETLPDCLDQVGSWFEHNYIGAEVRRGGRMVQIQPRFPHQLWNVHQRTIDGQHRTNNYAEAGNRRIQSEMGMETPTMGYFIDRLKLIQRGRDQAHVRWLQGYQAKPKRTKYRMADERILKVIEQYDNRSPIEFLGGVALNFMMD
ncbi:hypothetical protein DdX_15828 [Ditylenchus destructor]|uniref:MULE transposase domain-containing protein n=1 Tax=Ditylenchus destructor TaxID=166010 RepID=A0AAD4R0I1_9BILA|nr:hypothetical protein DdX_15828 [Ditylenchus destructor]